MTARTHDLKIRPEYFAPLIVGRKNFEIRRDDRGGFSEGDILRLREWDSKSGEYTGREASAGVEYVLQGYGPFRGFAIMSIRVFIVPDEDEVAT